MFKTYKTFLSAAVLAAVTATNAHAALVIQANGVEVLDTKTNLLWLYDWDSSTPNNDWAGAKAWAASLTVGGATAGSWRLPEIGEYTALFAEYGSPYSEFTDVSLGGFYWSATASPSGPFAYSFNANSGNTSSSFERWFGFAVAVRAANVAATQNSEVPEPQSLALALLALGATALTTRRRATRLQRCASAA